MLALEYGYRVSSACALAADGTQAAAEASEERFGPRFKTMLAWNGAAFAFLILSVLLGYFVSMRLAPLIAVAVLFWCAVFVFDALQAKREPPVSRLIVHPLSTEPWQAWPCLVTGDADSKTQHVYLMSPDQEVVRAFRTRMPEAVVKRFAHGMGVLWVCGDLESPPLPGARGPAMASVKGEIVWGVRHASKRAAMNGPRPTPACSRVIAEASSPEMDRLLNP